MIKLQLIGNLGKDAIVNNVNGKTVINFTAAHTEKYKDSQGVQKDRTIWVDCAYWTERTAIAPYLRKGTQVYLEGQPEVRTYTTQDGKSGATLTVRVSTVQLIGGRQENAVGGNYQQSNPASQPPSYQQTSQPATNNPAPMDDGLDDLPF